MAQLFGKKYIRAFISGFFVAMPVTVTFLDRVACIARVEGVSMQIFLFYFLNMIMGRPSCRSCS